MIHEEAERSDGTLTVATALPSRVAYWRVRAAGREAWSPAWQFRVPVRDAAAEGATLAEGDFDGDGVADALVTSSRESAGAGAARVWRGGAMIASAPSWERAGEDGAGAWFGDTASVAGDVNGDGYVDAAVGSPAAGAYAGRVYVYLGSSEGLGRTASWTLAGNDGVGSRFGAGLAQAGDINGDGYADLIGAALLIGVPAPGRVYVYFGRAGAPPAVPSQIITRPEGAPWYFAGIVPLGDVNGDGFADVCVVAGGYQDSAMRVTPAKVYVYLGNAMGLAPTPTLTLTGPGEGYRLYPNATGGDFNGDGYGDMAVGAFLVPPAGYVGVHYGGPMGLAAMPAQELTEAPASHTIAVGTAAADLNDDGYTDLVVRARHSSTGVCLLRVHLGGPSGVSATPVVTYEDPRAGGNTFATSMGSPGDLTGDGIADLLIGSSPYDGERGYAAIFAGNREGLSTSTVWRVDGTMPGALFGAIVAR